MSEVKYICTECPRPLGDYEDYKHMLGQMDESQYICPKCGVCRSCGHNPYGDVELGEELFLTGGSD